VRARRRACDLSATGRRPSASCRRRRRSAIRRWPKRKSGAPAQAASTAAQELALAIAAAGLDKKAVGVEVIDVSGRVDYADYLVIMTGTSDRHVHAIAMGIEEALKRKRVAPLSVEGPRHGDLGADGFLGRRRARLPGRQPPRL
jgi:ribosome-associated protein